MKKVHVNDNRGKTGWQTYCIREFCKENFPYVIELTFLRNATSGYTFEKCFRQQRHFASYIGAQMFQWKKERP